MNKWKRMMVSLAALAAVMSCGSKKEAQKVLVIKVYVLAEEGQAPVFTQVIR